MPAIFPHSPLDQKAKRDKSRSAGRTDRGRLAKIDARDLSFFGARFGCEPMGTPAEVVIVKPEPR